MLSQPLPPRRRPKNALRYDRLKLGEANSQSDIVTLRIIWHNFLRGIWHNEDVIDASSFNDLTREPLQYLIRSHFVFHL